jgi:hypothetical protein
MTKTAARTMTLQPLFCRLNLKHRWEMQSTTDGGRFRRCARCGKDKFDGTSGGGDWAAPAGF